jgi:hypothetical protein
MQLGLPAAVSLAFLMVVTHLRAQVMPRHNIQLRSKSRNFITDAEGRTLQDLDSYSYNKPIICTNFSNLFLE